MNAADDTAPRVRRAREGDQPRLLPLRLAALADAPEAFCSTPERERARPEWDSWVHDAGTYLLEAPDGALVGLACGTPGRDDPTEMFVQSVWIDPAWRGHGGADSLLTAVLDWGRQQGYTKASLHVGHRSRAARRCYERHGFTPNGDDFVREPDGIRETGMSRPLD